MQIGDTRFRKASYCLLIKPVMIIKFTKTTVWYKEENEYKYVSKKYAKENLLSLDQVMELLRNEI